MLLLQNFFVPGAKRDFNYWKTKPRCRADNQEASGDFLILDDFLWFSFRRQVEMEDWKTKSNKMTMELNELKAQYKELENKVGYFQEHKEV